MHTWNFEEHRPNFCFRDFFPAESGPNSGLEDVTRRLKTRANDLKGVRVSYGEGRETLVFTPNASEELYHFFRWGVCYPGNMSEQMVCLIGRELSDCTLVEFVAPVFLEHRNTDSAGFSERSRQSALEELDAINRAYLLESCGVFRLFDEPCRLVGFAHSHPAGVPFAPSEADLALQRDLMRTDGIGWSMLVNPQRRRIAAFFGKDMTVSDVLLLTEGRNVSRWTEA